MVREIKVGNVKIGGNKSLVIIAGPCVIENRKDCKQLATKLKELTKRLGLPLVFKASYDKANRTSIKSFRGPGIKEGLKILSEIKEELKVPILSDVHCSTHMDMASEVLDIIQIPAYLCRQTDLLLAAGKTGKTINIKKGQFLAPWDIKNVVEKIKSTGNNNILITERGVVHGYNNLVVDMCSLPVLRQTGYPVVFDVTHSVQLPGGAGTSSSGRPEFIPYLARAATACGIDALFLETHQNPETALSDGANMVRLSNLESILIQIKAIDKLVKEKLNVVE